MSKTTSRECRSNCLQKYYNTREIQSEYLLRNTLIVTHLTRATRIVNNPI